MKGLLITLMAAFGVASVMVLTPIIMYAPKQQPPPKDYGGTTIAPQNHIREIPLYPKQNQRIEPDPAPTSNPPALPPIVQMAPPVPEHKVETAKPPEQEVELPAKRHYGNRGGDICSRTGGWKVTVGRGWRCKYRHS
jgi:hypothetical protein